MSVNKTPIKIIYLFERTLKDEIKTDVEISKGEKMMPRKFIQRNPNTLSKNDSQFS